MSGLGACSEWYFNRFDGSWTRINHIGQSLRDCSWTRPVVSPVKTTWKLPVIAVIPFYMARWDWAVWKDYMFDLSALRNHTKNKLTWETLLAVTHVRLCCVNTSGIVVTGVDVTRSMQFTVFAKETWEAQTVSNTCVQHLYAHDKTIRKLSLKSANVKQRRTKL